MDGLLGGGYSLDEEEIVYEAIRKFGESNIEGGKWGYSLDSTGVRRADSFKKLSRSGRPFPVRSKSAYAELWSSLR